MNGRQPDGRDDRRDLLANHSASADDLFKFEIHRDEQPSEAVIRSVATATGKDPTSLDPLYESVDPDALDTLLTESDRIAVELEFDAHSVTVHNDGTVLVQSAAAMES